MHVYMYMHRTSLTGPRLRPKKIPNSMTDEVATVAERIDVPAWHMHTHVGMAERFDVPAWQ